MGSSCVWCQMTVSYGALEKKISEVNNGLQQHKDDVDNRFEGIQTALMYTAEDFERRLRALEVGREGGSGMTDRLPGPVNAAGGPQRLHDPRVSCVRCLLTTCMAALTTACVWWWDI